MKGFQGKGKETEELVQLYEKLEQDWHAMKQHSDSRTSNSHRCHYGAPSSSDSTMELEPMQQQYHYCCRSPRDIMCGLQRETSSSEEEEWRNAEEEIFQGCVEIIDREKLKGKKLVFYDALEDNEDAEVRSIVSYDSDEDHEEEEEEEYSSAGSAHSCCYSSSSSSSSCPFSDGYCGDSDEEVEGVADMVAAVAEMRVADAVGGFGNGRKSFGDFLRWLALAFLVIAVCACFARSYGGRDGSKVFFVPT